MSLHSTGRHLSGSHDTTYSDVMVDVGEMPAYVRALPVKFRREIERQCEGDWRRVTKDERGGITVHNRPQRDLDALDKLIAPTSPPRRAADQLPVDEDRPVPEPATPAWLKPPPARAPVDTSGFTRVELKDVRPPKKRTRRKNRTLSESAAPKAPDVLPDTTVTPGSDLFFGSDVTAALDNMFLPPPKS